VTSWRRCRRRCSTARDGAFQGPPGVAFALEAFQARPARGRERDFPHAPCRGDPSSGRRSSSAFSISNDPFDLGEARAGTPTTIFVLGGDGPLGRDMLERLLIGGRISLEVAFGASLLAVLIGLLLGGLAGYSATRSRSTPAAGGRAV